MNAVYMQAMEAHQQHLLHQQVRQHMGDALFPLVESNLTNGRDFMAANNFWVDAMTPGKIVGMMLEGMTFYELHRALTESPYLAERMVDACEVIMTAEGRVPFREVPT